MVHAFGVKPTPDLSYDLELFAYKFSEANLKRIAQHKSGKITFSGPQQFFSGAFFDFEIYSSAILRIHFVCLPLFEYLYLLV